MAKRAVVSYLGAGGTFTTFGDVSGDSINLEDSLTFTGSTYSPSGNTQTIDLADDQMPFLELNQGAGGGTLTLTIEPPDGRAEGKLVIHQHASSVRDISITSTGATIAHVGTQRTWTSDAAGAYIVVGWNYDGTRLFIDSGGGATGTDLNSNPNNSNVVIESSTGDDATIAPVDNAVCGVMTPAMLTKLNGTLQVLNPTAPETGLVGIAFAINTWNDGSQDWNVGRCLIQAGEESTARTLNQLVVDGDQGAYLASGTTTIGVVDDVYVISDPSLFRTTLGLGTMATQASTSYLALSGGTLTGQLINSRNSAVSSPTVTLTGTWYTGGTATTTKPHFLIEPTGTTSTAWSTNGTCIGANAASGFTGNLIDVKTNNTSQFRVSGAGTATTTSIVATQDITVPAILRDASYQYFYMDVNGLRLGSGTNTIRFYSGISTIGTTDLGLGRNAAGILEVNSGTGGTFRDVRLRDMYVNGMTSLGGGVGQIAIANATTVPTSNPTGGGLLYVEAGSLKFRGSSGTVTTLASP